MIRHVFPLLLVGPLAIGCGSDNRTAALEPVTDARFTARFVERTMFSIDGERSQDMTRGAFDWDSMKGWAEERTGGLVTRTVQIGDACYQRAGTGPWKKSIAGDPEGTCSLALFQSPTSEFKLLQQVAGLETVGKAEVRGTRTTQYDGTLNIGAVKGTIEVWVDDAGRVLRSRQVADDQSFTSTRDYYDLGAEVTIQPPKLSS